MKNSSHHFSTYLLTITLFFLLLSVCLSKRPPKNKPAPFEYSIFNENIPQSTRISIMSLTGNQNCSSISPINQIKYGQINVAETKEADFCSEYSKRSCCSLDNFNSLKSAFKRQMNNRLEMTVPCQKALQQLICYDCDSDIGQGFRKGVCINECNQLYEMCKDDYFVLDEKVSMNVRVCNKNDILCLKLKDILSQENSSQFCELLGYEINENNDYDEWFSQFVEEIVIHSTFEPVCWNFYPSSFFLGPIVPQPPIPQPPTQKPTESKEKNKDKSKFDKFPSFDKLTQKYDLILNILYGIIAFIVLMVLVYCCYAYCCEKKERDLHDD